MIFKASITATQLDTVAVVMQSKSEKFFLSIFHQRNSWLCSKKFFVRKMLVRTEQQQRKKKMCTNPLVHPYVTYVHWQDFRLQVKLKQLLLQSSIRPWCIGGKGKVATKNRMIWSLIGVSQKSHTNIRDYKNGSFGYQIFYIKKKWSFLEYTQTTSSLFLLFFY